MRERAHIEPLVLVVDDDPDILEAICDILEGEGYRVARARHGGEALDQFDEERPDAILLDLMMPIMDGIGFAVALRGRHGRHGVPIIVISADGTPQKVSAVGARAFLAKPFDIGTLLEHVASAVQSPGDASVAAGPPN